MSSFWWKRGAAGKKKAVAAGAATSGATGESHRGFGNWFRGLDHPKGLVRFFKRSKEFVYYTAHGDDATFVATTFYRTTGVISQFGDVPSVTVSVRLFSAIVPALLNERKRVEVWELQGGRWKVCGQASPGCVEGVLSENVPTDGADGALDEASAEAVMMSVFAKPTKGSGRWAGGEVGVAYCSTAFRVIGLMQFEDGPELKLLESVAVQIGARECLLEDGSCIGAAAAPIVEACGAPAMQQKQEDFRGKPEDILRDVAALIGGGDGGSSSSKNFVESGVVDLSEGGGGGSGDGGAEQKSLAAAADMRYALSALAGLARHLGLLDDADLQGTFSLVVGSPENYVQYDGAVAKALTVFPAPRRSRTAVLLAQNPAEAAAAAGSGSGGDGGEIGGGGGGGGSDGEDGGSGAAAAPAPAGFVPMMEGSDVSLLGLVSNKCSLMGVRRLRWWLQHPLVDVTEMRKRQAALSFLVEHAGLRKTLRDDATCLNGLVDLEAAAQKFVRKPPRATLATMLVVYRASARMEAIAAAIEATVKSSGGGSVGGGSSSTSQNASFPGAAQERDALVSGAAALTDGVAAALRKHIKELGRFRALCEEVVDVEIVQRSSGRLVRVRPSFNEELSRLAEEEQETADEMRGILTAATAAAGHGAAGKVKLECSPVHGDHLRITKKEQKLLGKIPGAQTLSVQKSGVLFTTEELKRLSLRASNLRQRYAETAAEVESQAIEVASSYAHVISAAAQVLSELDALLGLASAAVEWDWCAPTLLPPGSQTFRIRGLRHPIVEASVGRSAFIANDLEAGEDSRLIIVTGPNCGGKSTYIRSVGIACLLAQIGSFVPADSAVLSVVDRIMARVGASDSQLKGVSTFMAEMLDTAAILKHATRKSLVIVDELGRGTSSEDGFGIAWAVACRLARAGCVTLFATHFHELVALEKEPGIPAQNLHVTARAEGGQLRMLYRVKKGGCDKSFGIEVARIAGFPAKVVAEAERLAAALEAGSGPLRKRIPSGGGGGDGTGESGQSPAKRARLAEADAPEGAGGVSGGAAAAAQAAAISTLPPSFVSEFVKMPLGATTCSEAEAQGIVERVLELYRRCCRNNGSGSGGSGE